MLPRMQACRYGSSETEVKVNIRWGREGIADILLEKCEEARCRDEMEDESAKECSGTLASEDDETACIGLSTFHPYSHSFFDLFMCTYSLPNSHQPALT